MAKLPRTTQKIFGKNAPENQITTFGSIKAGTPVYTQSASQIMNSAFEGGWSEAVEDDYAPYRQDRNAVDTALTQQLAYLFQEGIPEWDSGTTYYKGSVVKVVNGNALTFYKSIADNNTSSVNTTAKWHKMLEINASNQIVSPTINTPTISGGSMSNGTFSNPTFSGTVNVPLASQSSSTDSTIAASIGWANNPSLSSNIVHRTGDETISGSKTFVNTLQTTTSIVFKRTTVTKGTNPESTQFWQLFFADKNGSGDANSLGKIQTSVDSNGLVQTSMYALKNVSGTSNARISIYYPTSGSAYTYAPTPATSDDSTKIATTAYVKAQGYALDNAVVKTSGDQTVDGEKTFTSQVTKTNRLAAADTIFVNKNTAIKKGTAPSGNVESRWRLTDSSTGDSNSALIGGVVFGYSTSMRTSAILQVGKPEAGSTSTASLGIYYPSSGNPYTEAPTPDSGDNSTKISTTAWVNSKIETNLSVNMSNRVSVSESTLTSGYTAPNNGFIYVSGANTSNSVISFLIDKNYVGYNGYQNTPLTQCNTFYLSKGNVFKISRAFSSSFNAYFVPLG